MRRRTKQPVQIRRVADCESVVSPGRGGGANFLKFHVFFYEVARSRPSCARPRCAPRASRTRLLAISAASSVFSWDECVTIFAVHSANLVAVFQSHN